MFKKIVVASDGSKGASRALSMGIDLAGTHQADLHKIAVEELPQFPASVAEVIEEKGEANHFFEGVISRAKAQAQAQRLTHSRPTSSPVIRSEQLSNSWNASTLIY